MGAFAIMVALMDVAFVAAESHSKHLLLYISAISFVPKLSNTHSPGSIVKSAEEASPHATKSEIFVTVTPPLWAAFVVPLTSLAPPLSMFVVVLLVV